MRALKPPFFLAWFSGEDDDEGTRKDGEEAAPVDMALSLRCTMDSRD